MNWGHVLKAHYNVHLDPLEVDAWKKKLREIKTTDAEIIAAIEAASAADTQPADRFRANIRDLTRWIKTRRAKLAQANTRLDLEPWHIAFIGDWKAKLETGDSDEDDFIAAALTLPVNSTKTTNEIARQVLGRRIF